MTIHASSLVELPVPIVDSVFHPTDLESSSEPAFVHALAIALVRRTRFDILHAGSGKQEDWSRLPRVRETLERWGLLPPGSDRSAVFDELSVRVRKLNVSGDPVRRTLEHIAKTEPGLVVLGSEGRNGAAAWLDPSKASAIQRRSRSMCLIVPSGGRGFVAPEDGRLDLKRILVPVAETPDATETLERATLVASAFGDGPVEIEMLHVGDSPPPAFRRKDGADWVWNDVQVGGDPLEEILEASSKADLVMMPTDGRNGFLDMFRGSWTERVSRDIDCPLLAVPA